MARGKSDDDYGTGTNEGTGEPFNPAVDPVEADKASRDAIKNQENPETRAEQANPPKPEDFNMRMVGAVTNLIIAVRAVAAMMPNPNLVNNYIEAAARELNAGRDIISPPPEMPPNEHAEPPAGSVQAATARAEEAQRQQSYPGTPPEAGPKPAPAEHKD